MSGGGVAVEVVRGFDVQHKERTSLHRFSKRVLEDKNDLEARAVRRYYLGDTIEVLEVLVGLAGGKAGVVRVRRFDPTNLIARGTFAAGSCPILYVDEGGAWKRVRPVLVNAVSRTRRGIDVVPVPAGSDRFLIREEEAETSIVDGIELWVLSRSGQRLVLTPSLVKGVLRRNEGYVLRQGDGLEVAFEEPNLASEASRQLVVSGYYIPDREISRKSP
jgi:hypothetical protein